MQCRGCFRPLAGCGLFPWSCGTSSTVRSFRPLAGCGLFHMIPTIPNEDDKFPSPVGVWVVSWQSNPASEEQRVSVPWRGVGCFCQGAASATGYQGFPSPCGVWVVSLKLTIGSCCLSFPSPCGVWVVSRVCYADHKNTKSFRPLAGCGLFLERMAVRKEVWGFRPLAGCGLFPPNQAGVQDRGGFRPLAGCGLFLLFLVNLLCTLSFRPLAGCGLFRQSCTFFLVQQEKELSTLLFYCIILADVYQ